MGRSVTSPEHQHTNLNLSYHMEFLDTEYMMPGEEHSCHHDDNHDESEEKEDCNIIDGLEKSIGCGSISSAARGSFRHSHGDKITIGASSYSHSRFGNISIEVTSSTSFVEKSGNAEWHFSGASWKVTVLQDIPFVASKNSVFVFDRVHTDKEKEDAANLLVAARIASACLGV